MHANRTLSIHVKCQGWDSPTLKLYYLIFELGLFQWKTMLVEKTVIVDLGESRPWFLFSGVMSRLDRLFTLLSTSSSSSARHLAARQLGEVQRLHPHELHSLLARIHPLLRSSSWDTRFANCLSIKMAYFASRLKQVRGGIWKMNISRIYAHQRCTLQ